MPMADSSPLEKIPEKIQGNLANGGKMRYMNIKKSRKIAGFSQHREQKP
jgi:hypothetical protein